MKKINTGLSRQSKAGQTTISRVSNPNAPIGRLSILNRVLNERTSDLSNTNTSMNLTDRSITRLIRNEESDNHAKRCVRRHAQFKRESDFLSRKIAKKIDNRKKINLYKLYDEVIKTLENSISLKEVMFAKKYDAPDPHFKSNILKKKIVFKKVNTDRTFVRPN